MWTDAAMSPSLHILLVASDGARHLRAILQQTGFEPEQTTVVAPDRLSSEISDSHDVVVVQADERPPAELMKAVRDTYPQTPIVLVADVGEHMEGVATVVSSADLSLLGAAVTRAVRSAAPESDPAPATRPLIMPDEGNGEASHGAGASISVDAPELPSAAPDLEPLAWQGEMQQDDLSALVDIVISAQEEPNDEAIYKRAVAAIEKMAGSPYVVLVVGGGDRPAIVEWSDSLPEATAVLLRQLGQRLPFEVAPTYVHAASKGTGSERAEVLQSVLRAASGQSLGCFPLVCRDTVEGAFIVLYDEPHLFEHDEIGYTQRFGRCLAAAIAQRRSEKERLAARAAADELLRLKSAFLANLCHEVRSPLTRILGEADLMLRDLDEEAAERARMIVQNARQLLATLDPVLALARAEASRAESHLEIIDVADETDAALKLLAPYVSGKGIYVDLTVPEEPALALLDRTCLRALFTVLLSNASQLSDGDEITVNVTVSDAEVVVLIRAPSDEQAIGLLEALSLNAQPEEDVVLEGWHGDLRVGLVAARRLVNLLDGSLSIANQQHDLSIAVAFPRHATYEVEHSGDGASRDMPPSPLLVRPTESENESYVARHEFDFGDAPIELPEAEREGEDDQALDANAQSNDRSHVDRPVKTSLHTSHTRALLSERSSLGETTGALVKAVADPESVPTAIPHPDELLSSNDGPSERAPSDEPALTAGWLEEQDLLAYEAESDKLDDCVATPLASSAKPNLIVSLDEEADEVVADEIESNQASLLTDEETQPELEDGDDGAREDQADALGVDTQTSPEAAMDAPTGATDSSHAEPQADEPPELDERPAVLIVEDNKDTRMLLERILRRSYHIKAVSDAPAALGAMNERCFDALVLDINLGGRQTGADILRIARTLPGYEEVFAIALTAYALPGDREKFLETGFDRYVSKPFTRTTLMGALHEGIPLET